MHFSRPRATLVAQILGLQLVVLAILVLVGTLLAMWLVQNQLDREYQDRALAVAASVAALPEVRDAVERGDPGRTLQPLAESIRTASGATFIVITNRLGIRFSHPNPAQIGKRVSTDPGPALSGQRWSGTQLGTLGLSVRGKVPIWGKDGTVIGIVSVGFLASSLGAELLGQLGPVALYLALALTLGTVASLFLARHLKRQTFGLEPQEIARLLEQREAMLHGIREGVVAADRANTITLVNDEARRLLRLDVDVAGRPLDEVVPAGRIRDVLAGVDEGPDQIVLSAGRILVANRMPVIVHGDVTGSVTTFRDRTELSGLHRELQGLRGITDALRAQVHEFSNRLHTIAGLIELGRGNEAIRLATEAAAVHQELAERLVERVGDPLLSALLLAKAAVASEQAIELRLSDDTLMSSEQPDARDLVTIVGNLIDNAFDAIRLSPPSAERWVDVQLREEVDGVVIRVADSGPGIDPVMSLRVFDEGFSTKEGKGRTRGLGLALVRQIVQRRGGTIGLENDPGAVFTVRMPRLADAPGRAARSRGEREDARDGARDAIASSPTAAPSTSRRSEFGRPHRGASPRLSRFAGRSADDPLGPGEQLKTKSVNHRP